MASKYPEDDSDDADSCKVNSKQSSFSSLELISDDFENMVEYEAPEEDYMNDLNGPDLHLISSMVKKVGCCSYLNEDVEAAYGANGYLFSDQPQPSTSGISTKTSLNPCSSEFYPEKSNKTSKTPLNPISPEFNPERSDKTFSKIEETVTKGTKNNFKSKKRLRNKGESDDYDSKISENPRKEIKNCEYESSSTDVNKKIRCVALLSIMQNEKKITGVSEISESDKLCDGGKKAFANITDDDFESSLKRMELMNIDNDIKEGLSDRNLTTLSSDINPIQKVLCWLEEPGNYGKKIGEEPKHILSTEPSVYVPKQEVLDLYNELKKKKELKHKDAQENQISWGCVQDKVNKAN